MGDLTPRRVLPSAWSVLFVMPLMFGCHGTTEARPSADAAVVYRDADYGFSFTLPADWENYSVLHERWESEEYKPRPDRAVIVAHGPIILLRHPLWTAALPRQDIPILVFTREQWRKNRQEGIFAGGVTYEIAHNDRYVFGIHSRFNANDEMEGSDEAGRIVARNEAAHRHLDER